MRLLEMDVIIEVTGFGEFKGYGNKENLETVVKDISLNVAKYWYTFKSLPPKGTAFENSLPEYEEVIVDKCLINFNNSTIKFYVK